MSKRRPTSTNCRLHAPATAGAARSCGLRRRPSSRVAYSIHVTMMRARRGSARLSEFSVAADAQGTWRVCHGANGPHGPAACRADRLQLATCGRHGVCTSSWADCVNRRSHAKRHVRTRTASAARVGSAAGSRPPDRTRPAAGRDPGAVRAPQRCGSPLPQPAALRLRASHVAARRLSFLDHSNRRGNPNPRGRVDSAKPGLGRGEQ